MLTKIGTSRASKPLVTLYAECRKNAWTLMLPALVVGIAAVLSEPSRPMTHHMSASPAVAFGMLLWVSLWLQLQWTVASVTGAWPTRNDAVFRNLTRQIYLVSFILAGVKAIQFVYSPATNMLVQQTMQTLQPYFAYALIAVIGIKAAFPLNCCRWFSRKLLVAIRAG